jgi:hypothetical protein
MKLETSIPLLYLSLCVGFIGSRTVIVAGAAGAAISNSKPSYVVPTFTVNELQDGSRDTDLIKILASTGLLAIRVPIGEDHIPANEPFSLVTGGGGGLLCQCKDDIGGPQRIQNGSAEKILLADGLTTRSTIATATNGLYERLPLPKDDIVEICGPEVYALLERARDYVSRASNDYFIPALDRLIESSFSEDLRYEEELPQQQKNPSPRRTILTKANGQGYDSVSSIVQDAMNLEHFHSYSKRKTPLRSSSTPVAIDDALDWHTDGGLFLAFLPAKSCNDPQHSDDSFVIKMPDVAHSETKVIFPQDQVGEVVVGIMLGIGAEEWLDLPSSSSSSSKPLQFRATRHAVKMSGGDERVWYGKMHLVSQDAIVYRKKDKNGFFDTQHVTFSDFRKSSQGRSINRSVHDGNVGMGCGNHHHPVMLSKDLVLDNSHSISLGYERRHLQHVGKRSLLFFHSKQLMCLSHNTCFYDITLPFKISTFPLFTGGPNECNNINSFYCWLSCLDISNDNNDQHSFSYHTNQMGESLYCLDPSILARTNDLQQAVEACSDPITGQAGGIMNVACGNYWHATVDGVSTYTNLYAGGDNDDGNSTSTAPLQYCYGKTGMYMQGFEWEATTCIVFLFGSWVISTRAALFGACIGTILLGMLVEAIIYQRRNVMGKMYPKGSKKKMILSAVLYGTQLTFSYVVMLLVMTYSIPIFMSVILGLVSGHVVFNWADIAVEKDHDEDDTVERNYNDDALRESAIQADTTTTTRAGEQQHHCCS